MKWRIFTNFYANFSTKVLICFRDYQHSAASLSPGLVANLHHNSNIVVYPQAPLRSKDTT